jgi:hypothetical protein
MEDAHEISYRGFKRFAFNRMWGGGSGNSNSDINSLYIENSEFFTSFTLDSDVTISRGLAYYPVSDDIFIDFASNVRNRGFIEDHAYAPTCYEFGVDIAETCSDIVNGKRWVTMLVENVTDANTDEYVKGFFPQLNAPLSIRILFIDFYDDKSVQLSKHEKYLKESLNFENYNDGTSDICLRKYEGEIVYSFCYGIKNSLSYANWAIAEKTFFDASLSDINSLYIENSEFFTSLDSFIPISDATIGRGLLYYPVVDDVFENFRDDIESQDFTLFAYASEACYEYGPSVDIADTCYGIENGERWVSIWVDNTTDINTAVDAYEYVIDFFPQINASLSARSLSIDFDDDKSIQLLAYEEYLRNTLRFEDYNGGSVDKCLKLDGDEIVYSFCYGIDGYRSYANLAIVKKTLFYAMLNSL